MTDLSRFLFGKSTKAKKTTDQSCKCSALRSALDANYRDQTAQSEAVPSRFHNGSVIVLLLYVAFKALHIVVRHICNH